MIEMRVCRGGSVYDPPQCNLSDTALNWGDPITDPILCTEESATERGRVEIDTNYTNRIQIGAGNPSQDFVQPGCIVEISTNANTSKGLLTGITIEYSRQDNEISAHSEFTVELNDNPI